MPYIPQSDREELLSLTLSDLCSEYQDLTPGELNYIISQLLVSEWNKNPSYTNGNALMGVLSSAQAEFYRKQLAPYEDLKEKENGSVTILY